MKIFIFMMRGLILFSTLSWSEFVYGAEIQELDSVMSTNNCDIHKLSLKQVAIPASIFVASTLFIDTDCCEDIRYNVQNALSAKGQKIKADDYIQYLPMISVYGLNLCNVKGHHNLIDSSVILAISYATMGVLVNSMKPLFREKRPDTDALNSFPSGHTATVFMGAEFLRKEYRDVSPWIGFAGYAVAIATGYLRIYNNRHYFNDVVAGACIGYLSTNFAYWLYPKFFKKHICPQNKSNITGLAYFTPKGIGINFTVQF